MMAEEERRIMAATYKMAAYPKEISFRDGSTATVRPLEPGDADGLLDFFLSIPEEDRFFLKDDVASPAQIREWTQHLNFDRALPLVALDNDRIVAEAVLLRSRGKARSHIAEIRIAVTPDWRNRGLGSALMRELCDIAADAELDAVHFEVVEDGESAAVEAAGAIGFVRVGRIEGGARDQQGHLHDIVLLAMPLHKYYEWSKY
jgi:L-amino acid N-acyltransferase YncA